MLTKKKINPSTNVFRETLAVFFIIYILIWNIKTTGRFKTLQETDQLDWVAYLLRIDQHWGMFAPSVFKDDGWFIFETKKNNGTHEDILNPGEEVSFKRPKELPSLFKSDRWRKYSENFLLIMNAHLRPYFCFYILNQWNSEKDRNEKIHELEIFYVKEISLPDYKTGVPKKELLCNCTVKSD